MENKKNIACDIGRFKGLFFNLGLTVAIAFVILAFEWKSYDDTDLLQQALIQEHFDEFIELPITRQPPPPQPRNIVIPNIIEIPNEEEIMEVIEINLDIEIAEPIEIAQVIAETEPEVEEIDEILLFVEQNPKFIGGDSAFAQFVSHNLTYPEKARRMGLEGRVFIKCVVEKDGSLSNFDVMRGVGGGCDSEALRVIQQSPNWQPGHQRGRAVRVQLIIPITFRLN
jgi:protein TonB